ncbi:YaaR family protein [Ruminiclostridium herbifermentans]|uniref:YaaR family protein n=1 Tax=Ruminiclostridium herbifermentans TaxID=2488810 RepID=A0A4U7JGR5_9FIRM|nr:YaaR family protein [Ruminiclostridium herbifermentans]
MKIQDTSNNSRIKTFPERDERTIRNERDVNFASQMRRLETANYEERIRTLADKIQSQGKKLEKKADIRDLKIYKKLISEFLDEAVAHSHSFSKKSFLDRRGRHRVYAIIKKINEELIELTNEVLKAEQDNIKILKKLEDIRGLILDLFL